MDPSSGGGGGRGGSSFLSAWVAAASRRHQHLLDKATPHVLRRWAWLGVLALVYTVRVWIAQGFYIVSYALGIYILNLFIAFLSPQVDPEIQEIVDGGPGPSLPTRSSDEFRPFVRRLPEFKFWSFGEDEREQKTMAVLSLFDSLYCQEDSLELEEDRTGPVPPVLDELDAVAEEEWANVLCFLTAKEEETRPELSVDCGGEDTYLLSARREAVEWVDRTAARHAFSVLTAMLAVNYLDRCFLPSAAAGGLRLQKDKPWMGRLAAVACLSLAAKVEETSVPLLLDLQAAATPEPEENKYVFEAKTIRRMELLVLSTLSWRMNPVTPLSFVHHLLLRLYPKDKNAISTTTAALIRELMGGCETILLSVIAGECAHRNALLSPQNLSSLFG
ncbi:hypothetical protein BHM03_00010796 [Ensete ventricosum]|nr:hypothetical protein BHM03_00010796 [Ensete ventricosum]